MFPKVDERQMQPGVLQSRKDLHVRYDLMLLVLVRVLLKRALADSNMEVAFPIEEARFDLASWGSGWFSGLFKHRDQARTSRKM